jgi:tyrosyl-tRNA synthetase
VPLIVDRATGKKFGKSEGNAVWLSAEKTTPFAFYQFWLNTNDESVGDFLKLFTFLSLDQIEAIIEEWQKNPGERRAQRALAHSVTSFVHGETVALQVANASEALFGNGTLQGLNGDEIALVRENAPLFGVAPSTSVADALVRSGLATSKREARTFIESGAVSVDGEKVTATDTHLSDTIGVLHLLKRGKKNVSVIEVEA